MVTCPSCGQENPAGFRLCGMCGAPLQEAPRAREERKVVTVLFCDLVGSTARAERLDPEDVRALLSRYHERVRNELERFGGTVEKFIGDAVMALFGAPAAHEDDPERAVRAALAIRDWAQDEPDLQVRIGITTGETLVALAADPRAGEGMASGDVVNTAARLQSAAPPNGIVVDEKSYRATRDRIDYRDAGRVDAKGKAEPVAVWEPLEARSRVEVERPARAELVGREPELDTLVDALNRVKREREPQLVTLVGVPGIGKSRLVYELYRSIEQGEDLVYWRRGRSLPYGEGVSFWALGEIVKAQAGILESDAADVATAKVRAVTETLLDPVDAGWVSGHVAALVGAGSEGELGGDRREEASAAWRRFLEALAEQRPTVLVFEDLHWADEAMLDFVDELVEWSEGVPLLVLCTARPELLDRRPAWSGGKVNATTLLLSPLSGDETARLVHALLGSSVLPAELQESVLERAGGNPLYAEEFIRLVEEGRPQAELPESVQGIIAARLDVLSTGEKELLQAAAIAGRTFWAGELAVIGDSDRPDLEETLRGLARREFVQRERRSSVARETQYVFRHALVREVAYGQIPRAERADKHRRAAEWIESLGRAEDHAEMLAHHYLSALEYARATGTDVAALADEARHALRAAGDRALALHAYEAAIRYYEAALEHWPEHDHAYPRLLFSFGTALQRTNDRRVEPTLGRAAELLVATDRERAAEAHTLLAEDAWDRGDRARVDRHLAEARRLVSEARPSASVARVLTAISRFRMLASDYDEAMAAGREALAIAENLGLDEIRAGALNNMGTTRLRIQDVQALDDLERSVEIAVASGSPEAARGYNNLAVAVHGVLGDLERSRKLRAEAVRIGERFGAIRTARFARGCLVIHDYSLGRWDDALAIADEFSAESARVGFGYADVFVRAFRASIFVARGDVERAEADSRYALELAREAGDPQALHPALQRRAQVELDLGAATDAREHAREGLVEVARARDGVGLSELVVLALRLGLEDELLPVLAALERLPWVPIARKMLAREYVDAADDLARFGDRPAEAGARMLGAENFVADGRRADADLQLQKALAIYRSVGAKRYVRQAETLLAASA
jgi:class 3 adenylate cyclase/tetratricopeptide (TPR) repeat protein